jgi:hypothetical protein
MTIHPDHNNTRRRMGDTPAPTTKAAMAGLALPLLLACMSLVPGAVQAQGQVPISGIYTCIDAKGRKLTSDRPIPECLDREQKVLNPSGTVRARVGPNLTEKEHAEIEARQKQEAEARALLLEEKRRERALLARYPTRAVHDRERAAAFGQVAAVAQAAQKRIEELLLDRRKLDQEMEFYVKDPTKAPPSLRRQLEEIEQGVQAQKRFISEREVELQRISARFDEELARLQPLWAAQSGARKSP